MQRNKKVEKLLVKIFNFRNLLIFIGALYVIIVFFQNINIFSQFITSVLNKSITLNSRTYIWNTCIDLFKSHPFIGNGIISSDVFVRLTGIPGGTQPHNFVFGLTVASGMCGAIIYVFAFYKAFRGMKKNVFDERYICSLAIMATLVLGLSSYNTFAAMTFALYILMDKLRDMR